MCLSSRNTELLRSSDLLANYPAPAANILTSRHCTKILVVNCIIIRVKRGIKKENEEIYQFVFPGSIYTTEILKIFHTNICTKHAIRRRASAFC
jgi:hypothetical protein